MKLIDGARADYDSLNRPEIVLKESLIVVERKEVINTH
jgi:hypothetical protein